MQRCRPVMLVVLDGWGRRDEVVNDAVRQARTPNFDHLWSSCPHALVQTSGLDVGLPPGQMGNSEVGHLNNLGALYRGDRASSPHIAAPPVTVADIEREFDAPHLRQPRSL